MATLDDVRALIDSGDLIEARDRLVDLLYEDYDNFDAWMLLTECANDADEYARAVREALRIDPDNPEARRLAVDLALQGQSGTRAAQDNRRQGGAMRALGNLIIFFFVVAVGIGIVAAVLFFTEDTDTSSELAQQTADPQNVCAAIVRSTYNRVAARCALQPAGTLCLANPDISVIADNPMGEMLPGDLVDLAGVNSVSAGLFNETDSTWGLAALRNDLADSSLRVFISPGTQITSIQDNLQAFTVSSNPVVSSCDTIPPSGALITTDDTTHQATINGLDFTITGTMFIQVDVAGGMRIIIFEGSTIVTVEGINASTSARIDTSQWMTLDVNGQLMLDDVPGEAMIGAPPLRGDVMLIQELANALEIDTANWQVPDGPVEIAMQPTVTPTRGLRLPSATPTLTLTPTPRISSTPRPTLTPSNTPVPTSTSIPVLDATATATPTNTPDVSPTTAPDAEVVVAEIPAQVSGTWSCIAVVNDLSFTYILTLEPLLIRNQALASAQLPEYGDAIVILEGEQFTEPNNLDVNWTRIPSYQNGDTWYIFEESRMLYAPPGTGYEATGTLRIIHDNGLLSGGIFEDERLVGILSQCEAL